VDDKRRSYLLKLALGKDFRRAVHAIAELYAGRVSAEALVEPKRIDEQRAFQYRVGRIVLGQGLRGLVDAWPTLADPQWRAQLIDEVGPPLWEDPAQIDLAIAALEDPAKEVGGKAVWRMLGLLREPERKSRSRMGESEQRFIEVAAKLRAAMTPAQRARMTRALVAMLTSDPQAVGSQLVELVGYTATSADSAAIQALEALRARSGAPYTVTHERVAKEDFEPYEKQILEKRGHDPEEMRRITYKPTGLLDAKLLEETLHRIKQRAP